MIRPTAPPTHTCMAEGCTRRIPVVATMCGRHWPLVPADLQEAIDQRGGAGPYLLRAVNVVARVEGREVPYPHAEPGAAPPPPPSRPRPTPGELDPVIVAAVRAGRPLTLVEAADIARHHGPANDPRTAADAFTCAACRFRYGKRHSACPSVVFVNAGAAGMRAMWARFPAPTAQRRCRTPGCTSVLTVPAGSADGGLCESCTDQSQLDLWGEA